MDEPVTLDQLLAARESRAVRQRMLIDLYKVPLISFMVNTPGPRKDTALSGRIFGEGVKILRDELKARGIRRVQEEIRYLPTGAEAFISADSDEIRLKEIFSGIEENHPLGRLFDFDIIGRDYCHVSRSGLGKPARPCLICGDNAFACGRSGRHKLEELIEKMGSMAEEYFAQQCLPPEGGVGCADGRRTFPAATPPVTSRQPPRRGSR